MAFVKSNLNPLGKNTADSPVRAIAAAAKISYDEAFKQVAEVAFQKKLSMWEESVVEQVLKNNGFLVGKVKVPKGSKRPTVQEFAADNPNLIAVLRISHYFVACGYGNYVDTFDCGGKSIYKYYYKNID